MFFRRFKKIVAGILIGSGIGILLILYLPSHFWPVILGVGLIIVGFKYLFKC